MKIISFNEKFSSPEKSVVTIGTFDGLHLGHREIIEALKKNLKNLDFAVLLLHFIRIQEQ